MVLFTACSIYPRIPARLIFLNFNSKHVILPLKFSHGLALPRVIIKVKLAIQSYPQYLPLFHLGIFKLCNISNILEITETHITNRHIQTTHILQILSSTFFSDLIFLR